MNRKMIFIIIVLLSILILVFAIIMSNKKADNNYNSKYPVININYDINDFHRHKKMEFYMYNNTPPNKVISSMGKFEIIQNSNYMFNLTMMSPGRNERENPISIFNMEPCSKYTLTLSNANNNIQGNNHIVELYINNEYKGLYTLDIANMLKGGNNNE